MKSGYTILTVFASPAAASHVITYCSSSERHRLRQAAASCAKSCTRFNQTPPMFGRKFCQV